MNKVRALLIASAAMLLAACSSTPKQPEAPPVPNLAGNWIVTIESQMGAQDSKLNLTQAGSDLKGQMESPMGTVDVAGKVADKDVTLGFNINAQGMDLKIDFIGVLEGTDTIKGRAVFGSFGEGTFSAKKQL
jgi:opacity protein-like surface antigen